MEQIQVEYGICLFNKRRLSAKNVFCTQTDFVNHTEVHRQTMFDPRHEQVVCCDGPPVWFGDKVPGWELLFQVGLCLVPISSEVVRIFKS